MVGGKREKDELKALKEQKRSIKGRPVAVKDKSLDIKDVRVESQLSNSEPQNIEYRMTKTEGSNRTD